MLGTRGELRRWPRTRITVSQYLGSWETRGSSSEEKRKIIFNLLSTLQMHGLGHAETGQPRFPTIGAQLCANPRDPKERAKVA